MPGAPNLLGQSQLLPYAASKGKVVEGLSLEASPTLGLASRLTFHLLLLPRLQSELFIASSHAPPNSQFKCMAIIPRMPSSFSRLFLDPPVDFTAPTPVLDPLRNSGGEPPPPHRPRNVGYQFTDSFNSTQFRDSLAILQGFVFELRQGVEDLQIRLQATDEKVAVFLQTLSSMHEAFSSDSAEVTPMEEPSATLGEGHDKVQRSAEMGREQDGRESSVGEMESARKPLQNATTGVDGTACDVKFERQWADQVTYVEEEPWTEDLHTTWSSYLPGV